MSIISSKSNRQKQGFTPYQSQDFNQKQISLLSKLNLNDNIFQEQPHKIVPSFDKYSCDLRSIASKKRKLSEQFINLNQSKIGGKTFLNRSIIGKSSLDQSFVNEFEFGDSQQNSLKKEINQNSCPLPVNSEEPDYINYEGHIQTQRPRFTKTKNLLRNLSNYMHKFILYNKRGEEWLRKHFKAQEQKSLKKRKKSQEISVSNRSSELSCFQDMCRIQDSVKMEDTPKIQASMMHYSHPSDSDHFLNTGKDQELEEQCSPMKEEKNEGKNEIRIEEEKQLKMLEKIKEFNNWISQLSIVNFSDYESVWTKPHKFRALYRIICYKYYRSEAVCDIYRSRLTTKEISVSYLHQFMEGLLQPSQFYRFK